MTWLTKNFSLGTGGSIKFVVAPQSDLFSSAFYEGLFFCYLFPALLSPGVTAEFEMRYLNGPRSAKTWPELFTQWWEHIWDLFKFKDMPNHSLFLLRSPSVALCARVCVCLSPSPSLSLVVNGDVKYLNTLCCAGTMHSSRWTGPARVGCMQISIQSSPGCFQSNTSASGPVLIPLYPQPARFFIKSNAVSALSTWTSGPTTKPEGEQDRRASVGERIWLAWNIWRWVWDMERLREMSKGLCGIVLELLNKSSLTLLLHSAASVEIQAREAFVCLGGKHVAEMRALSLCLSFLHRFFFPCRFLFAFSKGNEWCWGLSGLNDCFLMWQMKQGAARHLETPGTSAPSERTITQACAQRVWTLLIQLLVQLKHWTDGAWKLHISMLQHPLTDELINQPVNWSWLMSERKEGVFDRWFV